MGSEPSLEAVEGRPDGMVLALRAPDARVGESLELHRRAGEEGDFVRYRTFDLDERLVGALRGPGLRFLDRRLEATRQYTYVIRIVRGGERRHSEPLSLRWPAVPGPPAGLGARLALPGVIEVYWHHTRALPVIVLRRDLVARGGYRRVGLVEAGAAGVFLDRGVRPGGVYAYRIAYARRADGTLFFGEPTPEYFVTVPGDEDRSGSPRGG